MTHDFKLLIDELRYKLTVAFNRINTLELSLQDKISHIHLLEERLGLDVPIKYSEEGKEKKYNGKS